MNLMNRVLLSLLLLPCCATAGAQTIACPSTPDSAVLIGIARKHHAWWTENPSLPPALAYDALHCRCTIKSSRIRQTRKGRCRYTNGCTELTTVTLVIDARSKKVLDRNHRKDRRPNYE
jgi:hypothetical protein